LAQLQRQAAVNTKREIRVEGIAICAGLARFSCANTDRIRPKTTINALRNFNSRATH
jgi:hypothetical protein